ncbi:MAG: hypothetical protein K2O27_03690 [Candidatus Amulumruptor sp.]|nr:hypothetical protein [Candidatus Amulumruptor sp.]
MNKLLVTLTVLMLCASSAWGRIDDAETYRFDIGAGLGMSGYLGDANESSIFHKPGFAANLQMRYLFNERTAIRAQLTGLSLSGNTADFDNMLPGGEQYSFSAFATDLSVRGEFNFLPYGMGETYRRLRRVTPFLALGLGDTRSSAEGS